MNWIVKNDSPAEPIKPFEERMAELQDKVKAATVEELESWMRSELGDLCQAARIELRKRSNVQPNTNYSEAWTR